MDPQAEAFLQYYAALKMSGATIGSYRQSLRFFSAFLEERGKTLCEATAADVNDFIAAHAEWTASTIANRQSALRSFYKWAQTQHMLAGDNPMLPIRSPRQHQVRNKPYVHEDEARLLRETRRTYRNGTSRAQDLRDRCLIALIYATGLRVAEVASLNVGHIRGMDPTHRSFIYRGKGGSEQTWYLNAEIYGMLTRYLRTLDATNPGAPLFSNRYGKRLSIRSIQKILADRGRKVLGRPIHPHMLRRGFGNAFYTASGYDIHATSQALHHANIATTQGYLAVDSESLMRIVDRMGVGAMPAHSARQEENFRNLPEG